MPSSATQDRLQELRTALKSKVDANENITKSFKEEEKGKFVVSPEQRDAFRSNLNEAKEIQTWIADLESQLGVDEFIKSVGGEGSVAGRAAAAAEEAKSRGDQPQFTGGNEFKSLGARFTESDEFKALRTSGGATMQKAFEFEGRDLAGQWGQKDIYTYLPTGPSIAPRFGQTQVDPLIIQPFRRTRVRDLFPVQTTSANLIDFFRVSGFTNNASVVPERSGGAFGLKPQSSLSIVAAQAAVRTIAHFEVAHRNVIADEPQLQGLINNELLYGLRLQEDYQILQGTGTTEDLLGVLNTPGIQGYTHDTGASPADNKADDIRRAATKAILAYYEPTGVIEHPYDWEATELAKDSQGRYLVAGGVASGADKTLWQLPVVDTPAMPQGTGLVGAFGLGAQLYDREQGNVRIAEQHADFFIRNAIVVLAEERLALAVKRPESFVKVSF